MAITGASGAGTTSIKRAFSIIFRREDINAFYVNGENFRRYDRAEMQSKLQEAEASGKALSPYGPEVNRFDYLETLFRDYTQSGTGRMRRYISCEVAEETGLEEGRFTDWETLPPDSDLLFYEGLHGGVVSKRWTRRKMSVSHNPRVVVERRNTTAVEGIDVAQYVDLLIGIVPVVNLEWMQKISHDMKLRGFSSQETARRIVERMEDYIHFITPQFSVTDINFQRVPIVDTSNPFVASEIPIESECIVVIRFREPAKYNFPDIMKRIPGAVMSRPNTMVIPGGKMQQAIDVICTPLISNLVAARRALEPIV